MARESGRQPGGPTAAKTLAWKVRVAGRSERGQGPGEVTGPDCGGPCGQEAIQGLVVSGGSGRSTGAAELAAALEGQKRWGRKREPSERARRQADEGGAGGGGGREPRGGRGGGAQGGAGSRVLRQLSYPLLSGLNAGCERRRGITADAVNPVVRGQVALRK